MPFAENLGTGGGSLDAQYGSSPTANTNAPLLLDPRTSGNFVYTPGTAGNYVSVPHSDSLNILGVEGTPRFSVVDGAPPNQRATTSDESALDIAGDIDIKLWWRPDGWNIVYGPFGKYGAAGQRSWLVRIIGGNIVLRTSADGTATIDGTSTASVPFTAGQAGWIRATLDVDDGAGNRVYKFYTSTDGSNWTQLGTTVTTAGTTSIFNSTASVDLMSVTGAAGDRASGDIYRAIIQGAFDTPNNTASVVFDADFTQQTLGSRGFIESTGKLVSLVGNAAQIVDGTTYGTMPSTTVAAGWTVPDSAALDINDFNVTFRVSLNDWNTGAINQTLMGKWDNPVVNSRTLIISFASGLCYVDYTLDNVTNLGANSGASFGFTNGQTYWVRVSRNATSGVWTFEKANDSQTEPTSWTLVGTFNGTAGNLNNSSANLTFGAFGNACTGYISQGRFYRAIIRNANTGGTKVLDADFTRQLQFASTFTEGSSQLATVTTVGAARIERDRDLDIRVKVAMDDWTPASLTILAAKWNTTTNQRSFYFGVEASGELRLSIDSVGTSAGQVNAISTVPTGIANGSVKWVRVTLDVNNGSGGRVYTFFLSDDGITWTQLGATVSATGAVSPFNGTALVELGSINDGTAAIAASRFYAAQMLNGINGPAVLDIDFTDAITTGAETYLPDTVTEVIPEALQYLPNLGWGGTALNARFGSAVGADTNDPLLLTHTGTNYLYLPGSSGNSTTTPDFAAMSFNNDMDVRWAGTFTHTGSNIPFVAQDEGSATLRRFTMYASTTNLLGLIWSQDGTAVFIKTSTANIPTIPAGQVICLRATLDIDNGAAGNTVEFWFKFASESGAAAALASNTDWTALGSPVITAGTTGLADIAANVRVGSSGALATFPQSIYRAMYLNGINGTVVFDANFTTGITSGAQTTFTESSPNAATVTINRSTSGRKSVAVVQDVLLFGTDDYLEVPDNDLLDFGASDSFTVMTAVRQWATPLAGRLIDKSSGTAGWGIVNNGTNLQARVIIADSVGGVNATNATYTAGSLMTLAGVRDTTADTLTTWLNGVTTTPVTDTTTGTLVNANPLAIGKAAFGATAFQDFEFRGSAIWRRALSSTELALVNTHYTTGPTAASTALMQQAVWWIDAGTRSVAQINRSTSGRKSVACARCTWLLGTDDFFEVPDSPLWDFAQGQDYTLLVLHRDWWAQGTNDTLLATSSSTTASAAGWAMSNSSGDPWQAGGRHGDGSNGVTAVAPRRDVGALTGTFLVRDCDNDTLTAFTGSTSGTPVTDTITGTIGNTNVMRLGRLSTTGTEYLDAEVVAAVVWRRRLTAAERNAVLAYYGV